MPTYTVKQGEDWISLAAKLQVPLQNLLNLNPDIKSLSAGTGLRVPRVPASAATQTLAGQTPKGGGRGFLQGQGPPKPPGGKGGGALPGGQLPIPPRYTPPAGRPYRPDQGPKALPPPPPPLPPQYKPGVQPRMILPPRPVNLYQRREQALSAMYPPAPRAPQAGAQATYYPPQYGGGYGATANLRAFPGARATATVTPSLPLYGGGITRPTRIPISGTRVTPPTGQRTFLEGLQQEFRGWGQRGFTLGGQQFTRPTPPPTIPGAEPTLPISATDAGEVQGVDGSWYGFVRMHNAVTDQPGRMYPANPPPERMYYESLIHGEPPPQMSEAVRIALGIDKDAMSVDWGYTWDEKTGFWVWGEQEAEGPQTLGYGGGGGYGGGYGYYGGGGGGGGGYTYSYPNYPAYEQQQQAYLPGRDRLPIGRFGLVTWQGI